MTQEPQRPLPPRTKKPAPRASAAQALSKPSTSKTLIVVRLLVALAAVMAAAGVAVYAIHSKMSAPLTEEATSPTSTANARRSHSTSTAQSQSQPQPGTSQPANTPAPAPPAKDVADNCLKWTTQIDDAIKAVSDADLAVAERLRMSAQERQAVLQAERNKLKAIEQRIQEAETATKTAEQREIALDEEVRKHIGAQSPICRLFAALDAVTESETILDAAKQREAETASALASLESKLQTNPRDRGLSSKVTETRKALDLAAQNRIAAQAALKRAEDEHEKAWKEIPHDSPRTKTLLEAGAKVKTVLDQFVKSEADRAAAEKEVKALEDQLSARSKEADAAGDNYEPIRQRFNELKKTASRLEELYKSDTGSSRYKDDAIAARQAVDDYKPTHDEALEAKQKAERALKDTRTKRDAAARDLSKKQQSLTDAQKALATERSAFVTSTKSLRQEEEAKDKVRMDKLAKAKQAAAEAREATTKANDAWYELEGERTNIEDSIRALEEAHRDATVPDVTHDALDALEALKKAISKLQINSNPTAGDLNLVLSKAMDAQRACDLAAADSTLERFSDIHGMSALLKQRQAAYFDAAVKSAALAWDAAELRDKRVK